MIQDWDTVILKKKDNINITPPVHNDAAIREMSYSIQKAIQQARLMCKMSQKDLARQLNVDVGVIISYENGKAVPNNGFISKIEKILNTKLPRANKKKIEEI
jgi:ribosome-binding protein aMBF1 (putative translation factor)